MSEQYDWVLATDVEGRSRHFAAAALPVTVGGEPGADIVLPGVRGVAQFGQLEGVFFVQPGRSTRNLRLDGELVAGSRKLADGAVVALDTARITCKIDAGRLLLHIVPGATAGDTAPPDLEELARAGAAASDVEITPIAFKPGAAGAAAARRRPSKTAIATGAAFAVLAVLAWFAFTAKSVRLELTPAPAELSLPGTLFKLQVGDRFLLRAGTHRVTATTPGYYPLDTEIEVGPAPDQTIELAFTKLPGLITLGTDPEVGADVRVDGESIGRTPLADVEITPGRHRLEFAAERYLPEVVELDVKGGHERQNVVASLTPSWAPVTITTEPPGAEVLVDGVPQGQTPLEAEIDAGERQLEVRLKGYNAWQSQLTVIAGQPQELPPITLQQADGRVELVTVPGEASVAVNGEFRGRTPLTLTLPPGRTHRVTLAKPGFETVVRELSVEADSGRKLEIELTALYGEVNVESEPAGAEVWVDGRREAATPAKLTLSAVEHEIEVRLAGHASQSQAITPRPGYPQQLSFELQALNDSTGSGYPPVVRTSLGQELRLVSAGQFLMGSSRREQGRRSNEVLKPVKISKAFYLGVREVTNGEFRQFKADHDSGDFGSVSLDDDAQPVVRVSWEEAAQFLNWLSIKDGLQPVYEERQGAWVPVRPLRNGYRLPTEAEWEWAARYAGSDKATVYPWGDELPPPDRSGNYADLSAEDVLQGTLVTYTDGFPVSAPSGSFPPNPLGIHDLGGNVAEWVQDYYEIEPNPSAELIVDPLGPETGRFHVVRGSSWRSYTVTELRLAYRDYSGEASEDIGFRIARNLE
ncbi:MAG TPA: PEGA domain-containing protein [Gammaproteobacteria bacterium]